MGAAEQPPVLWGPCGGFGFWGATPLSHPGGVLGTRGWQRERGWSLAAVNWDGLGAAGPSLGWGNCNPIKWGGHDPINPEPFPCGVWGWWGHPKPGAAAGMGSHWTPGPSLGCGMGAARPYRSLLALSRHSPMSRLVPLLLLAALSCATKPKRRPAAWDERPEGNPETPNPAALNPGG